MENRFKNLINIESLSVQTIERLISLANEFEKNPLKLSRAKDKSICMMFFENSTRTRFSFEMACQNLGARIFQFNSDTSSIQKGENFLDTVKNLEAIGIDAIVLRHKENLLQKNILESTKINFINAGSGEIAHPTQALLDFYTIKKHFKKITNKTLAIIGDIKHSRVAKSNIALLSKFGVRIICSAPDYFKDNEIKGVIWEDDLQKALEEADITMCLRIQRERIEKNTDFKDYIKNYQVNETNIGKNTILMHPGPINRGIEISENLLSTNISDTILEQAKNGVYVRMAVIDLLLGEV